MARFETRAKGVGVDQKWVDVSASRTIAVTYTNTTKNPITVLIIASNGNSSTGEAFISAVVDFKRKIYIRAENNAPIVSGSMIVPRGSTYKINILKGPSFTEVWELR